MNHIACGFTAMADATGRLTDEMLEVIKRRARRKHDSPVMPNYTLNSWDDLLNAILWHFKQGSGSEHIISDVSILEVLKGLSTWKWAVGGTGLQAACAAAIGGTKAAVNLPSWSDEFQFLLQHVGLVALVKEQGFTPVHYVLDYTTETASNRIILRGPDEFKTSIIAPSFMEHLQQSHGRYDWLLISGYNGVNTSEEVGPLLEESKQFLSSLGEHGPSVHLELGPIFTVEDQVNVIRELGPYVDSLGLNEDEMALLMNLEQPVLSLSNETLLDLLRVAYDRFNVPNMIFHTHQFAACVTKRKMDGWKEALHNAIRFASSRAAEGRCCTPSEMDAWEKRLPLHPRGERLAQLVEGREDIVIVPSYKAQAVSTVGLGDTFTAGLLAAAPLV
jgi:ADP-dependent phosphofructokinase/glucokinase